MTIPSGPNVAARARTISAVLASSSAEAVLPFQMDGYGASASRTAEASYQVGGHLPDDEALAVAEHVGLLLGAVAPGSEQGTRRPGELLRPLGRVHEPEQPQGLDRDLEAGVVLPARAAPLRHGIRDAVPGWTLRRAGEGLPDPSERPVDARRVLAAEQQQHLEDGEVVAGQRRPRRGLLARGAARGQVAPVVGLMSGHRVEHALDGGEVAGANAHAVQEAQDVGRERGRVVPREGEAGLPVRQAIDEGADTRIRDDRLARAADLGVVLRLPEHGGQGHEAGEGLVAREERGSGVTRQERQPCFTLRRHRPSPLVATSPCGPSCCQVEIHAPRERVPAIIVVFATTRSPSRRGAPPRFTLSMEYIRGEDLRSRFLKRIAWL